VEGVLFGVLVAGVGLHSGRNLFSDLFHHAVAAGEQRTKAVVNIFQNVAQAVQLRLGDCCARAGSGELREQSDLRRRGAGNGDTLCDGQGPLLAAAGIPFPRDMGEAELADFIDSQARERGLSLDLPFPLRIVEALSDARMHVVS